MKKFTSEIVRNWDAEANMKITHTPLPWMVNQSDVGLIGIHRDISNEKIADCDGPNRLANAALIVRAVNNHEALLGALKAFEGAFDHWHSNSGYLCECLDRLKEAENQGLKAEVARLHNLLARSIEARQAIARAEST
jgi:hypothetical protein